MIINHIITFVIVAFTIFLVVRAYNKMKANMEKKKAALEGPADPSKEEFGDSVSVLGVGGFLNHARNELWLRKYS